MNFGDDVLILLLSTLHAWSYIIPIPSCETSIRQINYTCVYFCAKMTVATLQVFVKELKK